MNNSKSLSWQIVEEVAALLEKSLTPSAEVKHNVRLPVIGKPGRRKRQCDVVITYGTPPRQTVSIVEVQRRASKPNITIFHGWYQKMKEVGAQHLICVSTRGYPQSIIDEAADIGPTVKLLTLDELRKPEVPGLIFAAPFVLHKKPRFAIKEVGPNIRLEETPEEIGVEFHSSNKVFTIGDSSDFKSIGDVVSLAIRDLSNELSQRQEGPPDSYLLELTLGSVDTDLWIHIKGKPYKVMSLPMKVSVKTTVSRIPITAFEYHQESIEGVLAWVAVAEGVVDDKPISVRFVFKKDDEGLLRIAAVHQEGVSSVGLMVSTERSVVEDYIRKSLQDNQ